MSRFSEHRAHRGLQEGVTLLPLLHTPRSLHVQELCEARAREAARRRFYALLGKGVVSAWCAIGLVCYVCA